MELLTVATIILSIYLYIQLWLERRRSYWAKRDVPYTEMKIPFISKPTGPRRAGFLDIQDTYTKFKKMGFKHYGSFENLRPSYVPIDPDIVRNILSKDFAHFMDRGVYYTEKHDPMSAQLFNLEGQRWRNLRAKLTPTFTSGKMKMMFQTLIDCGYPMVGKLEELRKQADPIDIKEILACFTTDVIGTCAFGIECNSFGSETPAFREAGKNFFGWNSLRMVRISIIQLLPEICKFLGVPMFEKSLTGFYFNAVDETAKYREANNITRNDFMQILLELKNHKDENERLTINEIAAQGLLFFLAGFETSSTLMYFTVHELTQNPEIQEKAREEVLEVLKRYDGKITYDAIMEMKYLSQILDEALRKYPPVPTLLRLCIKDYQIPGTDLVIEAGKKVTIPVHSLQNDPEYFPDPEKFDPNRFTDEEKGKRHPYVYMPFGEGPRICIGLRFGLMQARVGMALLLKDYKIKMNPTTITPIGISATAFMMASQHKLYVDLEKL